MFKQYCHLGLLAVMLFFASCFADDSKDAIVIKITKDKSFAPTLIFAAPGEKKITIENHLSKDIEIGQLYFIGDEDLTSAMVNSLSLVAHDMCVQIKSKTTCSYIINSNKNAPSTLKPNGEEFFLSYKVSGEETENIAKFNIKINYNEPITKPIRATAGGTIIGFLAIMIDKKIKRMAIAIINNPNAQPQDHNHIITSTIIGILTGLGVIGINFTNNTIDPTDELYDDQQIHNKIMETSFLHTSIGIVVCKDMMNYKTCVIKTAMCGLAGRATSEFIFYDPISYFLVPYLPKTLQKQWRNAKTILLFTASASVRVACKCQFGLPNGLFYEIYQDTMTAAILTGWTTETSPSVPTDNIKSCSVCTCDYLPQVHLMKTDF